MSLKQKRYTVEPYRSLRFKKIVFLVDNFRKFPQKWQNVGIYTSRIFFLRNFRKLSTKNTTKLEKVLNRYVFLKKLA